MSRTERVRAGHAPYIEAVHRCLEAHDMHVTSASTRCSGGRREAELHVRPEAAAFPGPVPEEASVSWDEENGWSLALRRDPATLAVVNPVYKGLSVIPDPQDVASWAVVLLTHAELTPSREDHPIRGYTVDDPEFEAELTRYAPDG